MLNSAVEAAAPGIENAGDHVAGANWANWSVGEGAHVHLPGGQTEWSSSFAIWLGGTPLVQVLEAEVKYAWLSTIEQVNGVESITTTSEVGLVSHVGLVDNVLQVLEKNWSERLVRHARVSVLIPTDVWVEVVEVHLSFWL